MWAVPRENLLGVVGLGIQAPVQRHGLRARWQWCCLGHPGRVPGAGQLDVNIGSQPVGQRQRYAVVPGDLAQAPAAYPICLDRGVTLGTGSRCRCSWHGVSVSCRATVDTSNGARITRIGQAQGVPCARQQRHSAHQVSRSASTVAQGDRASASAGSDSGSMSDALQRARHGPRSAR